MTVTTNIEVFVVSWPGQHRNASEILAQLDEFRDRLSIVFSDPDPAFDMDVRCRKIRRPNELFWSDKFTACMDSCRSDTMLVLHADCTCSDWPALVRKCIDAFDQYPALGVWAPSMRGTAFEIENTIISERSGTSLCMVTQTDAICFALSKRVVARMQRADYSDNIYGWGIAQLMVANAYCSNMLVLVDKSVEVQHAGNTGYSRIDAEAQYRHFLKQFTPQEFAQFRLLNAFSRELRKR